MSQCMFEKSFVKTHWVGRAHSKNSKGATRSTFVHIFRFQRELLASPPSPPQPPAPSPRPWSLPLRPVSLVSALNLKRTFRKTANPISSALPPAFDDLLRSNVSPIPTIGRPPAKKTMPPFPVSTLTLASAHLPETSTEALYPITAKHLFLLEWCPPGTWKMKTKVIMSSKLKSAGHQFWLANWPSLQN